MPNISAYISVSQWFGFFILQAYERDFLCSVCLYMYHFRETYPHPEEWCRTIIVHGINGSASYSRPGRWRACEGVQSGLKISVLCCILFVKTQKCFFFLNYVFIKKRLIRINRYHRVSSLMFWCETIHVLYDTYIRMYLYVQKHIIAICLSPFSTAVGLLY